MNSDSTSIRESILQQALALDPADRAFVADKLERSLPETAFSSADVAAAWSKEIDRRIAAFDCGEVNTIGLDETLGRVQQALAERRSHS